MPTSEDIPGRNHGTKANNFVELINRGRQRRNLSPPTDTTTKPNLANASRVPLVVLLVKNVDQIAHPDALQAHKLVVLLHIHQPEEQLLGHDTNLARLHTRRVHLPQSETRAAVGPPGAHPGQDEGVAARDEEGEDEAWRGPEGQERAPGAGLEIERGDGEGVNPQDVEFVVEEGGGEGLGGESGSEVVRERREELPGLGLGIVNLDGERLLDVDETADEANLAGDEKGRGGEDNEKGVEAV